MTAKIYLHFSLIAKAKATDGIYFIYVAARPLYNPINPSYYITPFVIEYNDTFDLT